MVWLYCAVWCCGAVLCAAKNGVVIASEKKVPSILVDVKSVEKISLITENIGVTYSGMGPDNRVLLRGARKAAQKYYLQYKDPIPVQQLVREVASVAQEFTQQGGVRPFGVSLLIAGYDADGPQLYQVDPSGSYWAWKASAIGKNATNAKTFLEKRYLSNPDMELEGIITHSLLSAILHHHHITSHHITNQPIVCCVVLQMRLTPLF